MIAQVQIEFSGSSETYWVTVEHQGKTYECNVNDYCSNVGGILVRDRQINWNNAPPDDISDDLDSKIQDTLNECRETVNETLTYECEIEVEEDE